MGVLKKMFNTGESNDKIIEHENNIITCDCSLLKSHEITKHSQDKGAQATWRVITCDITHELNVKSHVIKPFSYCSRLNP